jgi:hypothetical protein
MSDQSTAGHSAGVMLAPRPLSVTTFTWRRTGSSLPGALIAGIFVTWYIVAGTATQAAF